MGTLLFMTPKTWKHSKRAPPGRLEFRHIPAQRELPGQGGATMRLESRAGEAVWTGARRGVRLKLDQKETYGLFFSCFYAFPAKEGLIAEAMRTRACKRPSGAPACWGALAVRHVAA